MNILNENIINQLKNSSADIMYVYSEKSATNLKNLIKKYSLVDDLINCNLMCISEKTSRVLRGLKWKKFLYLTLEKKNFYCIKFNYGNISKLFISIYSGLEARYFRYRYLSNINRLRNFSNFFIV